ncbi:hypothetical protein M3147_06310 [Agromyces mediolanus]|uniref:hypothetical protein n=1 Tax=Agromyces mediolanus TaxID=41986 RepID=UPI00203B8A36|nr:hypothetical protein [Agromyces mediolanus]MCM3656864.1 hypothetical protein [Agromyces mediolanus]
MAALHVTGSDVVHLDRLTFMWVQLVRFDLDVSKSDSELLELLISSPGYGHRLRNPDEFRHEYSWVTGALGFHEFVAIDRRSGVLHLVVACDD